MSLPVSPAITTAIEQLELEARTAETQAGELHDRAKVCRDLVTQLRTAFGVSTIAPPTVHRQSEPPATPLQPRRQRATTDSGTCRVPIESLQPAPPRPAAATRPGPAPRVSDDDIVRIVATAGRPLRKREIYDSLPTPRPGTEQFALQLARLIESQRIRRVGETTATRYVMPAPGTVLQSSVERSIRQPAPKGNDDTVISSHTSATDTPSAGATETTSPPLVDLSGSVLEALKGQLDGLKFDDLLNRVPDASRARLMTTMSTLTAERRVARIEVDGKTRYRLPIAGEDLIPGPPVRSVAIPTFDPLALRQKVESLLASGITYSLDELVMSARSTQPHATKDNVEASLAYLVNAKRAKVVHLGSRLRYQRLEAASA